MQFSVPGSLRWCGWPPIAQQRRSFSASIIAISCRLIQSFVHCRSFPAEGLVRPGCALLTKGALFTQEVAMKVIIKEKCKNESQLVFPANLDLAWPYEA
jgi:hypothetical protein